MSIDETLNPIDIEDIQYHVDKQKIQVNVDDMYKAFKNIGYRENTIYNTIYDIIESRIKSDKQHKLMGIEYKSIQYKKE